MALLPFEPQFSSSYSTTPKVKTVSFSDGYEQRFANEINSLKKEYQLTFTLLTQDAETLLNFLENLKGVDHFQWQGPHDSAPVNYVCQEWTYALIPLGATQISAKIRRVFEA